MNGKNNIAIGFLTMGLFMAYGFLLIYLRDFAPGKEEWVNSYSIGNNIIFHISDMSYHIGIHLPFFTIVKFDGFTFIIVMMIIMFSNFWLIT